MYNGGGNQQQFAGGPLYVPPAFRQGTGGNDQQQRGGAAPRPNNNYAGRASYDPRPTNYNNDPRQYQQQQPRPAFNQRGGGFADQNRGGPPRQAYGGRFSYDQRTMHDQQQWEDQSS